MKASLNWIRFINQKYGSAADPAPTGVDKLVEKIGAQLGQVEEVVDVGKKYQGILVVKVVGCKKMENSDHLSLCLVDDGGQNKKVKRTTDNHIEVVCGAPNVKAGMLTAWIPPGSTVPESFDKEQFVIEAREIRGKISNGMLASAKELALSDDHSGIIDLQDVNPGDDLAEAIGLNDAVIDIENKMFTHRPDLFGQLGIARELAGIQHMPFKSPDWYREDTKPLSDGRKNVLKLQIKNELPKLVPGFCAVAIKDIKVGPSPLWLQVRLNNVGIRSINNIVDITNFYMMETAQPLHAYDYDKLKTGILGVRMSKKGEELKIIGDKIIKLNHGAMVITDGHKPIGLGGVMGGAETEVDESTKNIVLEVATFDMNATRRAAMAYGLFTDAATRFTKNQSPRQNLAVLTKAVEDIKRLAGGRQASEVIDVKHFDNTSIKIKVTVYFINDRLGLKLSAKQIQKLLENVEFKVTVSGGSLTITVPFWRTDIEIPEDIVEEVGRLYGYDHLPLELPKRDLAPAVRNQMVDFKNRLREILRTAGCSEVLTYSFVHGDLLKKVGQNPKDAYQLANALSPDLQYYRLALVPSLLEKVQPNVRAGFDEFALFELGKCHYKDLLDEEKLPKELDRLALVVASKDTKKGAPYYAAKKICDYLLHEIGIHNVVYTPLDPNHGSKMATYYEPARTALLTVNGIKIGRVGEYKQSVKDALKLPKYCAGFALDMDELIHLSTPPTYQPINRFPEVEQDFNLRSSSDLSYEELTQFILINLDMLSKPHGYSYSIRPLDIYQREDDNTHKQTTWRIILWHPERTLMIKETNKLLDELAKRAKDKLNAERI